MNISLFSARFSLRTLEVNVENSPTIQQIIASPEMFPQAVSELSAYIAELAVSFSFVFRNPFLYIEQREECCSVFLLGVDSENAYQVDFYPSGEAYFLGNAFKMVESGTFRHVWLDLKPRHENPVLGVECLNWSEAMSRLSDLIAEIYDLRRRALEADMAIADQKALQFCRDNASTEHTPTLVPPKVD